MNDTPVFALILVSAGAEWRALFPDLVDGLADRSPVEVTPYGECFQARINDQQVVFFHGGWGKVAAAASAEYAVSRWQPQRLVNLGTCGGFAGRVNAGDILLAEETLIYDIIEQMGDPHAAVEHYTSQPQWPNLPRNLSVPLRRVRLISADRDIVPEEIPFLVLQYDAVAADWESGAIAWVAGRHNLPCLILRGVSDVVAASGGEAYGALEVFQTRARSIMQTLLQLLPEILSAADR